MVRLLLGLIGEHFLGWDVECLGLEATCCRELSCESELDGWAGKGDESGWDVPMEISVKVRSHIEVSVESSACRFRSFSIDLLLV